MILFNLTRYSLSNLGKTPNYDVAISGESSGMIIEPKRRRRDAFGNFAESSHRQRGNLRTSCVLAGRNFFPQHSGGYKLRARQAAARNFRPLTRFQMFSEFARGKFETLPGLSRVTFNQICTILRARGQNLNRNPLNLYAREAVTSQHL